MRLFPLFLLMVLASPVQASYRVYRLRVTQYDAKGKVEKVQSALSILDHLQYENYYGGFRRMKVELVDTWYCPGDTSHHAYCKRPKVVERAPASFDHPKRGYLPYNRQPVIP